MAGDYSEARLGRTDSFKLGSASPSYLLSRGNADSMSHVYSMAKGKTREERGENFKGMTSSIKASHRIRDSYSPGRSQNFTSPKAADRSKARYN